MKKGKSNPYPLEQVQARRAQRQSQAIEGTSIPSKAVKPSGGDMMLNSHALLNLSAWFPKLFEKVSPLDGGAFEAVNAHDVVITATVAGIAGGILPIDLVADVLGMARNEAANRLADMVGFELRSSTSENRVDRKVQEEQRKQDRQAKQDAKDKAKRTRQAAMAKIYDESAASRVIKFQLHARALTAAAQASERAIAAHNQEILCRGKTIVRPVVVDAKGAGGAPTKVVKLTRVNNSYMRQLMDLAVAFEKPGPENGPPWVPVYPPPEVAELILSRWGHWPFPQLIGVISCPTLRPDGSLLTAQGYDPATRLYLMSDVTLPPISEAPTKADAEAALARLNELIREFPFNDEASRAVALSGLITPVVRGMLGRVPMHGVSGPAPGIGKSLLVDTASAIATGFTAEALSMSCEKPEQEKRLDAAILEAAPILNLDNVNGRLSSEKLCQIITAERVKIRVLGLSKTVEVESMTSVFLNGINVGLSVELARRTLMCRLDPKMEIPTDRDFESDPLEAVMANRGRYIADCLTIVMAYIAAGRPSRLPPKGKEFRAWSDNVRSALVWLGCADPRATMETARQDSPEQAERTEIFQAWEEEIGRDVELSTQQIIARAAYDPGVFQDDQREALRTALLTVAGQRGEISPDRLGKWLRDNRGQVVGDCRLERSACMRRGQYRWLLRAI
jgi:putative DNA primase/helicase